VRVALNVAFLAPGEQGGMETYARELAATLVARGDLDLVLLGNRLLDSAWPDAERVVLPVDPRRRAQWVLADQLHVPRAARRVRAELVHSLASTGPAVGRFARVTTVHDLNYKLVPDTHFGVRGLGMRVLVPLAARRAHRVVVPSESTRRDVVEHLGVPAERIDVVPHGAPAPDPPAVTPEAELRARLGLGEQPIVLSPSAKRPHKNLARLIRALADIEPARRPALVIPGYSTPHEAELRDLAVSLGVGDVVHLPAWLAAADLEGLYRAATCLVFPSLHEGFGLPVLEALARGLPVACSDRSSLPEVAGQAALVFDPEDSDAIREAIERLLADAGLRGRLSAAGREQAARFTWKRAAELTVASYRRALSEL
jgi:glycosyltransferase involved in cell wall biosynthesis